MAIDVVPTVIYSGMAGMTLFALVELWHKPRQTQHAYLAGLLFLLLVHILGELFLASGAYRFAPALAGAELPLRMLLGPAMYFYASAAMSPEKTLPRKSYLMALLGPVLAAAVFVPFAFGLSSEEKLALVDPATRNPDHFRLALFTCVASASMFLFFTGAYLVATFRLQSRHRAQLMERFSSIEKRSMDWFKVVLVFWGIAWLFYGLNYLLVFFRWHLFGSDILLPLLEAVILMSFAHLALRQPVLSESEKGTARATSPRPASLSDDRMAQIADKLNHVMAKEALFLNEELSLNQLSTAISVRENDISETLSQYLQTNFFHFVNGYRVEEAKRLLATTDKAVSTIAFDVGFNSKSTFNAAFKKAVGTPPSAYRNQAQQPTAKKI